MSMLIYAMIYAGSALMVYNIVRCHGFVKRMRTVNGLEKTQRILPVPLILLVFFLIGYLVVGLLGTPDFMIAGILFGGSVFVLIVFGVMYQVVDRLSESNARSDALYEEIRRELDDLSKDYLTVLHVNLTRDTVEKDTERGLLGIDFTGRRYSDLVEALQRDSLIVESEHGHYGAFERERLLASFEAGVTEIRETVLARMRGDEPCFVRIQATLAVQPGTGDVVAFITEAACNDEVVNDTLREKALIGQFDMITSLVGDRYRIVIGDPRAAERGSIYPAVESGGYDEYLEKQVLPVVCGSKDDRIGAFEALRIERVERELANKEPYEVNIAIEADGEVYYKRFVFYVVDRAARFYLLLKSDTTEARREEIEQNTHLQEALQEAQRASRSKTTFLSNMSHDIRTPMNAIVGYTDFARKSDDIEQVHAYLAKIDSSSKYMLALINNVLEMSRIESGKMEIDPERASLIMLMDDVRSLFESQMDEKHIDFTVDTSQVEVDCVYCDKTRLNRVLLNLISNAYKFTPEGGQVSVTLAQLDGAPEGYGSYELRVKDSGIGMSEEFAARVFDAFERERNTTTSGIQGTGLGMAIAKRIVDAMGGTIEMHTALGQGTEFIVRLTLELQKDARSEAIVSDCCRPKPLQVDFTGKKALLVEDNEVNREIAAMILGSLGLEIEQAVDGKQALDMLVSAGAGAYDIVVTDIQMPVMDGYEEARAIRALDDPVLSGIPIVAMSANAFQEDVRASHEAGMNAHVAKPIDVGALSHALMEALADAG